MRVLLLIGVLGLGPVAAGAPAVHTWIDADGIVHFSDTPPRPVIFEPVEPSDQPESPHSRPAGAAADVIGEIDDDLFVPYTLNELFVDERGPFTIGEIIEDTRPPRDERCRWARRDLVVLLDSRPVYRDQGGRLHYQWTRDPYRGARRYLDAAARTTTLASVNETLGRDCDVPDDPVAQAAARDGLLRSTLCSAEQAELRALEALGGTDQAPLREAKRTLVLDLCAEPGAGASAQGAGAQGASAGAQGAGAQGASPSSAGNPSAGIE